MASSLVHSLGLIACLAILPQIVGEFWAYTLALYFLYAIASLGIGITWGQAGFLPLGQSMFFGIAAYLSGFALIQFKDSWLLLILLPLAALTPGILAFGIGLLVFRGRSVTGPFFAMITLALTLLVFQIANGWNSVTGGFNGLKNIPGLPGLGEFLDLYYVAATALAVVMISYAWFRRAPLGVLWRALAQNERRVAFFGYRVHLQKSAVFAISGVFAGIAGALYAPQQGLVTPELCGFVFAAELVIWAAVGGRATLYGPVVGAIAISILTSELRDTISYWEVILALIFILVVLYFQHGVVGFIEPMIAKLWRKPVVLDNPVPVQNRQSGPTELKLRDVETSVGEVTILDGLSLEINGPGVYCLIGPNGAGKTSTFNVMTGELPARGGEIHLLGRKTNGRSAERLSREGVGRKFQIPSVFSELTIGENLGVAQWGGRCRPLDLLRTSLLRWRGPVLDEMERRFPFLKEYQKPAGDLSHGERQILELAMTLSTEPSILLLDEPSAGLSTTETTEVIEAIRWATDHLKALTIIVEHDMAFVRELADYVFVMHQGRLLAEGTVPEIRNNSAVQSVYIGASE